MDHLIAAGEHFLAGYTKDKNASLMERCAGGTIQCLLNTELHIDGQTDFAPTDSLFIKENDTCCYLMYNGMIWTNDNFAEKKIEGLQDPEAKEALISAYEFLKESRSGDRHSVISEARDDIPVNMRNFVGGFFTWMGHATIDYETLLSKGLPFIQKSIADSRAKINDSSQTAQDERDFLGALERVYEAIRALIGRYAEELSALMKSDITNEEKNRMAGLLGSFQRMLEGPPQNFIQAIHFYHFFTALDGYDNAGRIDRNLYPFYKISLERGEITKTEAVRLFAQMFGIWARRNFWNMAVAGSKTDGTSAANDLTEIILEARRLVDHPKPGLSFCLNKSTPQKYIDCAVETLAAGQGHPAFYNDELYIKGFLDMGYPAEDAARYSFGGCSETHIPGCSAARDCIFNILTAVECVIYGCFPEIKDGKMVLSDASADLRSFDGFFAQYKAVCESMVDNYVYLRNDTQMRMAKYFPALMRSLFVGDCIGRRSSHMESGARYNHGLIDVYGLANAADSLYTIRELVYTRKAVTLGQLKKAMSDNFEGYGELLRMCENLPKYGNDLPCVDDIAKSVFTHVFAYIRTKTLWKGGRYYGFCASAPGNHVFFGRVTGATPDGRLAGTPLSSSIGPSAGSDISGPTAMLASSAKPDMSLCIGTPVVNLSLSPEFLKEENRAVLVSLIRSYFGMGGMQLQFNMIESETLIDAKKNPDSHKNLLVRVAGYSARFVELDGDLQDEIIQRTVHAVSAR